MFWNQPGVPHKGWTCIGVDDVRDGGTISVEETDYAICEMCGKEQVRFVHNMVHDDYADTLRVGCVCAGKMEDPYAAERREKVARNRASRKSRWLSRRWRVSAKGNDFLNVDGHNVGVHRKGNGWGWRIGGDFGRKAYPTEDEAKLALFDECWERFWAE